MADVSILAGLGTEARDARSLELDRLSPEEFVALMNRFDQEAAEAVAQAAPAIAAAIAAIAERMEAGGRLFYIGAGTSGRLGVLDASECPPTFGVDSELVQGIIAGGDRALRYAIEGAEDDDTAAAADLAARGFCAGDALVAISASGWAPYCAGGLSHAREIGALAIAMACNRGARISAFADIAIEAPTGPEMLSGSTRLKAGTATKMMLNMLSTGVMVRLGKVYGNLMVDVRATNVKLHDRAKRIVAAAAGCSADEAAGWLDKAGWDVKAAVCMAKTGCSREEAARRLSSAHGRLREALGE